MNRKFKVLFFSAHLVHNKLPMAGNQTFNFYLGRFASDTKFEIAYVVSQTGGNDYLLMKEQFSSCRDFSFTPSIFVRAYNYLHYNTKLRGFAALISSKSYYVNILYCYSFLKAAKKIKKRDWDPDVVILEWTEMLFLYHSLKKIFPKAKFVCSEHDLAFISVERLFLGKGCFQKNIAKRFKTSELSLLKHLDIVATHNALDSNRLKDNGIEEEKIIVISPFFNEFVRFSENKTYSNNIIFFGAMGRSENIYAVRWFINEVFIPFNLYKYFSFTVIGGKGEALKKEYHSIPNIVFTGYIEDPTQYFKQALCMVAPIFHGAGIKVKVIEGMKAYLPVLTTQAGIDGIEAKDKYDFFLCETPKDYKEALQCLLEDSTLPSKIGANARNLIEKDFNYDNTYEAYKTKLLDIIAK